MQVLYERCAAVDVGKDVIAVAVRLPGDGPDGRQTVKRTFKTFYGVLAGGGPVAGLAGGHARGDGGDRDLFHAGLPCADRARGLREGAGCNAGHVKNVPGRKTDLADAEWLVQLLECGLLAGSFIPPAEIKAARDVIRYRAKVVPVADLGDPAARQRAAGRGHQARLGGLLHRHQVRAGDDRGADRRGAPPGRCSPSWPWAGCGPRSRTWRWRWRAGSASTTR